MKPLILVFKEGYAAILQLTNVEENMLGKLVGLSRKVNETFHSRCVFLYCSHRPSGTETSFLNLLTLLTRIGHRLTPPGMHQGHLTFESKHMAQTTTDNSMGVIRWAFQNTNVASVDRRTLSKLHVSALFYHPNAF